MNTGSFVFKNEQNTKFDVGDMFQWVNSDNSDNNTKCMLFIGEDKGCLQIPFQKCTDSDELNSWRGMGRKELTAGLVDGSIIRLPKGVKFVITQD